MPRGPPLYSDQAEEFARQRLQRVGPPSAGDIEPNVVGAYVREAGSDKPYCAGQLCARAFPDRAVGPALPVRLHRRAPNARAGTICSLVDDGRVGVFVDVENLAAFLKDGGAKLLVEWGAEHGKVVMRKAVGNFANGGVNAHQQSLTENGFELLHVAPPVSGKSTADIRMAVEVAESGRRPSAAAS